MGKNSITAESYEFFRTERLKGDLKGRSVRGGAVTMTSQSIKFFMRTGSMIVFARLLTPEDFGLIAMVAAIIMTKFSKFAHMLLIWKVMGITQYKININQIFGKAFTSDQHLMILRRWLS